MREQVVAVILPQVGHLERINSAAQLHFAAVDLPTGFRRLHFVHEHVRDGLIWSSHVHGKCGLIGVVDGARA